MQLGKNYLNINFTSNDSICLKKQQQETLSSTYAAFLPVYYNNKDMQTNNLSRIFKSYALIKEKSIGYKELKTFKAPYIGEGKIYKLDNGHKVIILPKPGPTVVNTFVKVGSLNDPRDIQGISHLLEHYIANGVNTSTSNSGTDTISTMGVNFSAGTANSYTQYKFKSNDCSEKKLEKILEISSKVFDLKNFDKESFDKEKAIVLRESNSPGNLDVSFSQKLISKFFTTNKIKDKFVGDEESLQQITGQKIIDHYNNWYNPDNMVTTIIGNVDPQKTIKCFSKNFGRKNNIRLKNKERFYQPIRKEINEPCSFELDGGNGDNVITTIGYLVPKSDSIKSKVCLDAFNFLTLMGFQFLSLNNLPSSPQAIVYTNICKLNEEKDSTNTINGLIALYTLNPISDESLKMTQLQLKKDFLIATESSSELSELLGKSLVTSGDIKQYTDYLKVLKGLKAEEIQNFLKNYLTLSKQQKYILRQNTSPKKLDSTRKVGFRGNLNKIDTSSVKEYDLDNNLHLVIDSAPGIAVTSGTFEVTNEGLTRRYRAGVYEILNKLLNQKHHLSPKCQTHAIDLLLYLKKENFGICFNCLPEKTQVAMSLIKDVFSKNTFTKEEFEKAKNNTKYEIQHNFKSKAYELAYNEISKDDLNSKGSDENILKNIDEVTLNDVNNLYKEFLANSQFKAVLTIPREYAQKYQKELVNFIDKSLPKFNKLKNNNKNSHISTLLSSKKKSTIVTEYSKDDTVCINKLFKLNDSISLKEDAALEVLDKILGYSRDSLLYKDMREEQRLAYALGSSYLARRILNIHVDTQAPVQLNNKTNKDNLRKSLEGINKAFSNLANKPSTQEELFLAKQFAKNLLLENVETSCGRNAILAEGLSTKYEINYINKKLKAIDEVTSKDIQNMAKKLLNQSFAISLKANKEMIDKNKEYLSSLGELKQVIA